MADRLIKAWAIAATITIIALAGLLYLQAPTSSPASTDSLGTNSPVDTALDSGSSQRVNVTGELTPQDVFKVVEGSVVSITSRATGGTIGQGSGFVYDGQGHIVTNNHVVEGATRFDVSFIDGSNVRGSLVGADPYSDLAVIKVDLPAGTHPALPLGDSSNLEVGQTILAIGNPFGLGGSMSAGIVSQLGRQLRAVGGFLIVGVIQIDAAVNPGNSGGPLLDLNGRVVGVNTAIASGTGAFSGIGFTIPSNTVKRVVPSLIASGTFKHPFVGISGLDVTPEIAEAMGLNEARGFLVTGVAPDGPAAEAGVKAGNRLQNINGVQVELGGDVVVGVDDVKVRKLDDILLYLEENVSVGQTVTFNVLRDGRPLEIHLTVSERPPP
ncbi:MAG: trypsin-like peptidase domain-containing protein [Thaumarchaeota archaeon]|nr:trypsin-like peptidase domain-containing protein [Nitrososphaerota archaeon]